jgi:hypothetical protein
LLLFFLTSRDFVDGGSCKFDPQSNLPNGNCIFVPAGDNSKVRSSYMSLPFLQNVNFDAFSFFELNRASS